MAFNSSKFTAICIVIYLVYAIFAFLILPFLVPNPLSMSRYILAQDTRSLGDLSSYTLETGGKPKRSMLVTFRGSGALSLLDYFSHQSGCYHHFSPLIAYGKRITNKGNAMHALKELISLYKCDYNYSTAMIRSGMLTSTFRKFYGLQSRICSNYPNDICWSPDTLSDICKIFPFINMSVYNLGLDVLKALLELKDLDLHMLFLVRDPRGTMVSRGNNSWCNDPECSKPNDLCKNLVSDYTIARELLKKYPNRFAIVTFEKLAQNPIQGLKKIFNFLNLPLSHLVPDAYGYFDQKSIKDDFLYFDKPMDWLSILSEKEIKNIQTTCKEAMQLWGYNPILSFSNIQPNDFVQMQELPFVLN